MASLPGNIWIEGTKIFILREDSTGGHIWSIEGKDEGPEPNLPPRSIVMEGNVLAYVDLYGHRRVIQLLDVGETLRPDRSLYIDPAAWLWVAKQAVPANRKMAVFHQDHSDTNHSNHSDYADEARHSDSTQQDWPTYTDHFNRTDYTDWSDIYNDYADAPHGNYADHANQEYIDFPQHMDDYVNWSDYLDHPHENQGGYQDRPHYNWTGHDDGGHQDWSDHDNYSDTPYSDHTDRPHSDYTDNHNDRPWQDVW